jgi:hypothetical protein
VVQKNKGVETRAEILPGQVVGEMAILYNCKRTATIVGQCASVSVRRSVCVRGCVRAWVCVGQCACVGVWVAVRGWVCVGQCACVGVRRSVCVGQCASVCVRGWVGVCAWVCE